MKRISLILALTICSAISFTACGNSETATKETTVTETTTKEETTTQEETTTGEYKYKGTKFGISTQKKEFFDEIVVENGYKFVLNDIVPQTTGNHYIDRGGIAGMILVALYSEQNPKKIDEFYNQYKKSGDHTLMIQYEDNVVIEYEGDKKMLFHFVEEKGYTSYYDVYAID